MTAPDHAERPRTPALAAAEAGRPSPLAEVLSDACQVADWQGVQPCPEPEDFTIQQSAGGGATHATFVADEHLVSLVVGPADKCTLTISRLEVVYASTSAHPVRLVAHHAPQESTSA